MTPASIKEAMALTAQHSTTKLLQDCVSSSQSRIDFWIEFARRIQPRSVAEIGVFQGDFAASLLQQCESIQSYYMVDPWRHLEDWNKPANVENTAFDQFLETTKQKTEFAAEKRVILRGKTTEVIDRISDVALDFAYIDGDHTLKGIAIDLIRVYPKVKVGGFVGGDDFTPTIWQHNTNFEPTLVCPFAVYFAEAVGTTVYALPYSQFCLQKETGGEFKFVDLTGKYGDISLRRQLAPAASLKVRLRERFPRLIDFAARSKRLFSSRR